MGADSVIYIRTDANSKISTGHLVRCISIAQALIDRKRRVCFLVSDEESLRLLNGFWEDQPRDTAQQRAEPLEASMSAMVLATARYDQPENELEELLSLLSDRPVLLIDSYFVTPAYLEALNKAAKTVYIDDLKTFDYLVDLLLNYDIISSDELPQLQRFYSSAKSLLLGAEYTPLRRQFSSYSPVFREIPQNALITSGGSDPYGFCLKLLTVLQNTPLSEHKELTFHVVIGKLFTAEEKQALHNLALSGKNIRLHEGLTDLAPLMQECDLAVSAAGTTLCELCAVGVPAISFTFADNQVDFARGFDRVGAIPYAGDIRNEDSDEIYEKIMNFLINMLENPEKRRLLQSKGRSLIDGEGSSRIAEALCGL